MVLEMRRALENLKKGEGKSYRRLFDAVYEEAYSRSLLIIQKEGTAREFLKDFFVELFGTVDEVQQAPDQEKWLWRKYYTKMRGQYQKLLKAQEKPKAGPRTLAELPSELPFLHRIMLVMSFMDDFTPAEISDIYGQDEGRIQEELRKLDRLLPALVKEQPESVSAYLGNWKVLLLGACRQIVGTSLDDWVDDVYEEAAREAGVQEKTTKRTSADYFVAEPDLSGMKLKKKPAPVPEPAEEDTEEGVEDDDDDEEDGIAEEYDEDEDDDDGRYDWDLEDDSRRMIIIGAIIALAVVAIIGFCAIRLTHKDKDGVEAPTQAEQDAEDEEDASLIIKGDAPEESEEDTEQEEPSEEGEEPSSSEEEPEEEPAEGEQAEEEPSEESAVQTMQVINMSSRVNVRSEASTDSQIVTKLGAGEKVEVLGDPAQEWVQIRCVGQDGQEGYVKSEYLKAAE